MSLRPAQAFPLALSGILTELHRGSDTVLTMLHPVVGLRDALAVLHGEWNVQTRGALRETLRALVAGEDERLLAFDVGRVAFLARLGALARMLTEDEAWELLVTNAARVQARFAGFEAFGRAYLTGLDGALRVEAEAALHRLLGSKGAWATIPWKVALADATRPAAPPAHVVPIPTGAPSTALAEAVTRAAPGTVFEIDEGVHATVSPTVSVALVARPNARPRHTHVVGHEGRPAVKVGDCGFLARRVMFSAPREDVIVDELGGALLEDCFVNAPGGGGRILASVDARARVTRTHFGARGVVQLSVVSLASMAPACS